MLSQIERRTEGNPFFIEEVVRALIADGTLVRDAEIGGWRLSGPVADLAIPDTVQGVIVTRIDRLEESVKSVLRLASVIGRSFFLRILKAIAQAADNVEQGLSRLEDAELIRLRQQIPEIEYIFKHARGALANRGGRPDRKIASHGAATRQAGLCSGAATDQEGGGGLAAGSDSAAWDSGLDVRLKKTGDHSMAAEHLGCRDHGHARRAGAHAARDGGPARRRRARR